MNNLVDIAMFCACLGTVVICVILIVTGIWRWFAHPIKRVKRLNIAAWSSVIILAAMIMIFLQKRNILKLLGNTSEGLTFAVIYVSKNAVKLLMLSAVVVCTLLLLRVVFMFVCYAIRVIGKASPGENKGKNLAKELHNIGRELFEIMKSPILILTVTCGIVGVFAIMPLLMGGSKGQSLSMIWQDGVKNIAFLVGNDSEEFSKALFTYILVFIIILGVGYAVIQILYSIISNIFTTKNNYSLIGEYSGSMGVLAVGVSILWTLQKRDVDIFDPETNAIWEFLKSFGSVLLIIAVGILVLEIIRLLMDMKKEMFIRIEARYLFICLVGEAALLLLDVLISLYGAASSAIGGKESVALNQVLERLRDAIVKAMNQQIDSQGDFKRVFSGFMGRSINKRGGKSGV